MRPRRWLILPILLLSLAPWTAACAQHAGGHAAHGATATTGDSARRWDAMAMAIPLVTRATPTAGRQSLTEGYLTQPMLMGAGTFASGEVQVVGTLDLEGWTLRRGELTTGIWGEGYVDRRHPHTYLHELVASATASLGRTRVSLSAGRGFAPFGTDDPMLRPFVKYPNNHHLAQILERTVVIAGVRRGPLLLEGAVFNGDEPAGPSSLPRVKRFGDSWATRAVWTPVTAIELVGSLARLESPEQPVGGGLDQRKMSAALRSTGTTRIGAAYAMAEWARTEDWRPDARAFVYGTWLAEGSMCGRRAGVAARLERTDRPEEERLFDLFRTPSPHDDYNLVGMTRFTTLTIAVTVPPRGGFGLRGAPFLEASAIRARPRTRGPLVPRAFYGSERMAMLSAGVRLHVGHWHRRMGRYGVAAEGAGTGARASFAGC